MYEQSVLLFLHLHAFMSLSSVLGTVEETCVCVMNAHAKATLLKTPYRKLKFEVSNLRLLDPDVSFFAFKCSLDVANKVDEIPQRKFYSGQ